MPALDIERIAQAYEAAEKAYDDASTTRKAGDRLPQEFRTDSLIADLDLGDYTREQVAHAHDRAWRDATDGGLFCEADPEMWAAEFAETLALPLG